MRRVLVFTVFDRIEYLTQTLESWGDVRGMDRWDVVFRIEPGPEQESMRALIWQWAGLHDVKIQCFVNPERYGVLHHPWVAFEEAFSDRDVGFVLRVEDDLPVSTDVLEYFEWASEEFADRLDIGAVIGWNMAEGNEDPYAVGLQASFNSWVWGTWREVWQDVMRDTWDHDYSTFNHAPGIEAGWDWNLNTRIFPRVGLLSVYPAHSRVQNIGTWGVHGTSDNLRQSKTYVPQRPVGSYHLDERTIVQA